MHLIDRTPEERTAFLADRIERFAGDMSPCGKNEFEKLKADIQAAFRAAETRGEQRGMIKGAALSKLSEVERKALGL